MEVFTTGTVTILDLTTGVNGQLVAIVGILDSATLVPEYFILWDLPVTQIDAPSVWVQRGMNLSMLREAHVSNQTVSIGHDSTSGVVEEVEFGTY